MDDLIRETLVMLAADVDDESPQVIAWVQGEMMTAGALDCVLIPTHMKKGRTGVRIEVLCREGDEDGLAELLLRGTSTLGVRLSRVERHSLPRAMRRVRWRGQSVRVKLALSGGVVLRAAPEHDDCVRVAAALGVPLREVLEGVRVATGEAFPQGSLPPAEE